MRQKPIPVIDLGARYQVITEPDHKWLTVGKGFAATPTVKRFMRKHGFRHLWVNDGIERKLITL